MKKLVTEIIDFIHRHLPPFFRFIPLQTFRYGAVGGVNMVYGIVQYWVIYNFILHQHDINLLNIVVVSAPVMAFLMNFVITFFTGFYLVKHIAFEESQVKSHVQMIRYGMVVVMNLGINYGGIKLFVEVCNFYPTISNALIQIITVNVSFLINKYFTFKA